MRMIWFRILVGLSLVLGTHQTWSGDAYWNDRYASDFSYTTDDRQNGLWSDEASLKEPYLYPSSDYKRTCSGCTCNEVDHTITDCSSSTVKVAQYSFYNTTNVTFSSSVTKIEILDCPDFYLIDPDTFKLLTNLVELRIQLTGVFSFPDTSNTKITILNLANNNIEFLRHNYTRQTLPNTLTHVALMNNQIQWLPSGYFTSSSIKMLSLSYNKFRTIPSDGLTGMSALEFLGMDGNVMKAISKKQLQTFTGTPLKHLNISNNQLENIESKALSAITDLKILEVHQNSFTELPFKSFYNLPELLHLDLNNNNLQILNSKAIMDMPKLITLRLHTQKTKMTAIMYDALSGIGAALENLWVSDNALITFPHQVLSEDSYPVLTKIWADNNKISNFTEYGSEAFPVYLQNSHTLKQKVHEPFATTPSVQILHLTTNLIEYVNDTDLCNMTNLKELYLGYNRIKETTLSDNAFTCVTNLRDLILDGNLIQYVPPCLIWHSRLQSIATLSMSSNKLTFLVAGTFSNLTTLLTLNLASNAIISIEDGTFPDQIVSISMGSNSFNFRHNNPFAYHSDMTTLDLSNNLIDELPPTAFHNCTSLTTL